MNWQFGPFYLFSFVCFFKRHLQCVILELKVCIFVGVLLYLLQAYFLEQKM